MPNDGETPRKDEDTKPETQAGAREGGGLDVDMDEAEIEASRNETESLLTGGPGAGNRSGGLAFLAFIVLALAVVHYHFAGDGGDGFLNRLDSELLTHAELALASSENGGRLTVVPTWPQRLYMSLRKDILVYVAASAVAAYLWGLSARARAKREAYLVHEKLVGEITELKSRLDRLEGCAPDAVRQDQSDRKGT